MRVGGRERVTAQASEGERKEASGGRRQGCGREGASVDQRVHE